MKRTLKKTFLILTLATSILACKNEKNQVKDIGNSFDISGEIKGLTSNLYFRHPDKSYQRGTPPDSIVVTDGKFSYSDSISELSMIRMYTNFKDSTNTLYKKPADGGYFPVKSMYLSVFAFPGAKINVSGQATDFMDAYPSGDAHNNSLADINKMAYPDFNKSANLMVQASFEKDSANIKELMLEAENINEAGREKRITYIKENPSSLGALWYLEDMIRRSQIEDDLAIQVFDNLDPQLHDFSLCKATATRIEGIKITAEGMPVPNIVSNATLDGSTFKMESLKGKFVLIDFWGTWCAPCVKEMPRVMEFQKKYNTDLVVLGINSGEKKEKIQEFLDKNGYDWPQLVSGKRDSPDNFVTQFNVKGFPTKFIIDTEGNIVKRYVGSGEEAFELLEELLNGTH